MMRGHHIQRFTSFFFSIFFYFGLNFLIAPFNIFRWWCWTKVQLLVNMIVPDTHIHHTHQHQQYDDKCRDTARRWLFILTMTIRWFFWPFLNFIMLDCTRILILGRFVLEGVGKLRMRVRKSGIYQLLRNSWSAISQQWLTIWCIQQSFPLGCYISLHLYIFK